MLRELSRRSRSKLWLNLFVLTLTSICCVSPTTAEVGRFTIEVSVTSDGKPIRSARVTIRRSSGDAAAQTDDRGVAVITNTFQDGRDYSIHVAADGYIDQNASLSSETLKGAAAQNRKVLVRVHLIVAAAEKKDEGESKGDDNAFKEKPPASVGTSTPLYQPIISIAEFVWDHLIAVALLVAAVVIAAILVRHRYGSFSPKLLGMMFRSDRVIDVSLDPNSSIGRTVKNIESQQQEIKTILVQIRNALEKLVPATLPTAVGPSFRPAIRPVPRPAPVRQPEMALQVGHGAPTSQDRAHSDYRMLIDGHPVSPEPAYLIAEAGPSSLDALKGIDVYLEEVNHTQGTFVMFKDTIGYGWVFPNPILLYKESALKLLFPDLTEDRFNRFKEQIDPVLVGSAENGRWRVES